jgi:biotin transport system substrate-specific component
MEGILRKEIVVNKTVARLSGVAVFVILTTLGAFVRIPLPFTPVPITLQTFFVLLSGSFLGASLGALSQIIYIALGVAGLPIFTVSGSGLLYLAGPTTGYLFGFILASFLIGKCLKYQNHSLISVFTFFLLADVLILGSGLAWLKFILGYKFSKLLSIAVLPFIPGDLSKACLAAVIYFKFKSRLKGIF